MKVSELTVSELMDAMEGVIDRQSLTVVLMALVDICNGKAEHLRTNWQDEAMARAWEKAGNVIARAQTKLPV